MKEIKSLEQLNITKDSRILAVYPHPDDETAFSAGFLHLAAKLEAKVRVVCMTKGEKSTLVFGLTEEDELAEVREKEFAQAMELLEVEDFEMKDIPDGEIEEYIGETEKNLIEEIESFKPDFVLTLEPSGIYGHPDHIALTQIVTQLFESGNYSFDLIYATIGEGIDFDESAKAMAKDPESVQPLRPEIQLNLDALTTLRKIQAFRAHKSQFGVEETFEQKWRARKLINHEYFVLKTNENRNNDPLASERNKV